MKNYDEKLYRYGMEEDAYGVYGVGLVDESKKNRMRRIEKQQKHLRRKKESAWESLYKYFLEGMWD